MGNRQYTVRYKDYFYGESKYIVVIARTTAEAYEKAMDQLGWLPFSAWVECYTCQSGKVHYFNNFEGKPY